MPQVIQTNTADLDISFDFEDARISAIATLPEVKNLQGMVILVHGLGGQKNSETHLELIPRLAECGIASLRFDFPGHGESTGSTRNLTIKSGARLIDAIIDRAQQQFGMIPTACIGSSFGATSILQSEGISTSLRAVVLRAPVSDYVSVRRAQLGRDGLAQWKKEGELTTLISRNRPSSYQFFEEAKTLDLYKKAQTQKIPLLIVQGSEDTTVPLKDTQKLRENWAGLCDFVTVCGGDHSFSETRHMRMFCALSCEWLAQHLSV